MQSFFDSLSRRPGVCFVILAMMMAIPAPSMAQTDLTTFEVPFLTLRNNTGSDDAGDLFGGARSGLSAGECQARALDFGNLAPLADSAPSFIQEEFLDVDQVRLSEPADLLDGIEASATAGEPAIYVHGYFIDFEKGCRRAVLFQNNANLGGRFLWFSWPSDGAIAYYTHDEADLYWSVPDLADAVIELERRFGSGVDVVGHSLGARGVVLALYDVANRHPNIRLDEIVLLAADMDFEIFQRFLPRISPIVNRITVYVTSDDEPLELSAQLHGYPRLGEGGNDVASLEGVEVIDVSELRTGSPTGHLYHIYSERVGDDLNQLLNDGTGAAERRNLMQNGPNSWLLLQSDQVD